jgi:NosR/NirI family nitrous oxide reductase transcriptional regulator/NosR/NirI family nitrite reductase transcriptional regulator
VIGIPPEALAAYVANFKGYDIVHAGSTLQPCSARVASGPHAIAGASVTSAVIRDAILRSARRGFCGREPQCRPVKPRPRSRKPAARLVAGACERGSATPARGDAREAARLLGTRDAEPEKTFIELWLALATPPPIGESLLGQRLYEVRARRDRGRMTICC